MTGDHADSILALIPARGGSKTVAGKNIAPVGGRPLIAWTIAAAKAAKCVSRVVVDTDNAAIGDVARAHGADTPYVRPAELARDDTLSMDVVIHALQWFDAHEGCCPRWLCLLQPTSPLRTAEDIDAAVALALQHDADAVVSVSESHHHPLWQKRLAPDGRISDYVQAPTRPLRRQDLAPAYALNGAIYLAKTNLLRAQRTWYTPHTFAYVMPPQRSLDVDSSWDLHLADLILSEPVHDQDDPTRTARDW